MTFQQRKFILITLIIFLLLFLFYKWQLATSNYYLDKGNDIYNAENFNMALKNYKYAATINGNKDIIYEAKIKRAEIFYDHWQLDKAERELLEAINKTKTNYRAYELLGDVYLAKREFSKSKDNYKRAIELNNNKIDNNLNLKLAKCLIANQELDLAEHVILSLPIGQTGLSKDAMVQQAHHDILYCLGLINLSREVSYNDYLKSVEDNENYKEKIREIKKVLEIYDAEKNGAYNNLVIADLYNKIGEPYFALHKTNAVTKNNPGYRDAWIISGKSNFIIGDYKRSLHDFNKALDLDSNNPEIHFWIASIYDKLENNSKSEELFNKFEK